jgi:hypothetical protein
LDTVIIKDGEVSFEVVVWNGNGPKPDYEIAGQKVYDRSGFRKIEGYSGVILNYPQLYPIFGGLNLGIKFKYLKIQKVSN